MPTTLAPPASPTSPTSPASPVTPGAPALGTPRVLLSGLAVGESPRWHDGRLWFCNWGTQEIVAVDLDGKHEVVARVPTTIPYCIDWLPDGRLLVVSGQEALLLRQEADGSLVTHADLSTLCDRPWNEILVGARGSVYLNSIGFRFGHEEFRPGIIALVSADGTIRQVAEGLAFPNGMVITPDGKTLIVAESFAQSLTAFDITPDGGLSNRRVWAPVGGDGICLDAEGAIWSSIVDQDRPACVRVREGGQIVDRVDLERACFACALGGPDGRTLFMLVAEWRGVQKMAALFSSRTGQVLTARAPAPGAPRA
jgi:sugar lactone lactonase YvrE